MSFRDLQPKKSLNTEQSNNSVILPIDHAVNNRYLKMRQWQDRLVKVGITLGGHSVIVAILLIFFFLLLQILPLMQSIDINRLASYQLPDTKLHFADNDSPRSYLAIEEQGEIAVNFLLDGHIHFIDTLSGKIIKESVLNIPDNAQITSLSASDAASSLVVYGLSNGQAIIVKHQYITTYQNNQRLITPEIVYPIGESAVTIDPQGRALEKISIATDEQMLTLVAFTEDRRLLLQNIIMNVARFAFSEDLLRAGGSLSAEDISTADGFLSAEGSRVVNNQQTTVIREINTELLQSGDRVDFLLLNKNQKNLFLLVNNKQGEGWLYFYRIKGKVKPELVQTVQISQQNDPVTAANFLTGGISLLLGKQSGEISQWFPVNKENIGLQLTEIRSFNTQQTDIIKIVPEMARKGFYAVDKTGQLGIYHTTADASLLLQKISAPPLTNLAIAPRANFFMIQDSRNKISFWSVNNQHPEVSWSSLWKKVWYENYPEPDFIWQSSSASNDFEPKFSLTPLALGTLKAAFYAMLFAMPLAIMGAIYTAYFMNARMRSLVKPTIEIMEALPTVIIGFLAGLWLAPFIDGHLPALFSLLFFLPMGVLFIAWIGHLVSLKNPFKDSFKVYIPDGWEALILIPVIICLVWLALVLSQPMEQFLFAGDMQSWLAREMGIHYEQRNSIIVGIAMGFAVIPTIFSITEDAVFNVPGHLTYGSMALGATRWQTLIRVVILTASPAIFSAVMVGFGRAIGETMIVLMATGNTPIMDFSIFQGMRTLSANIAIESPESEVASSHYRVLFLAAFILFMFTFFFNTIAEIIRQRLRRNYSNL